MTSNKSSWALRVILRDAGFEAVPTSNAEEALDATAVAVWTRRSSTSCSPNVSTASNSSAGSANGATYR